MTLAIEGLEYPVLSILVIASKYQGLGGIRRQACCPNPALRNSVAALRGRFGGG